MSKYTTQVRFICEQLSCLDSSVDFSNIELVIRSAYYKIFDFDFPIFDEAYRKPLCMKILRHFYFREIGFETYGLWKAYLNITLNDIMPYYNKLYNSELLTFEPLMNVDYTREHDRTENKDRDASGEANTTTETSTDSSNLYSDTPQGSISDLSGNTYLTNATIDSEDSEGKNETSTSETEDINTIEDYYEHVYGKEGTESYSSLLLKFRETFLNIDLQIIHELDDLFMLLW